MAGNGPSVSPDTAQDAANVLSLQSVCEAQPSAFMQNGHSPDARIESFSQIDQMRQQNPVPCPACLVLNVTKLDTQKRRDCDVVGSELGQRTDSPITKTASGTPP